MTTNEATTGRFSCHNLVHNGTSRCGLPTDHPSGVCDICRRALLAEQAPVKATTSKVAVGRDALVTVELPGHGEFKTTLDAVAKAERATKRQLAQMIADAYGGGCGKASTQAYWLIYPKAILTIVYGGLVTPKN